MNVLREEGQACAQEEGDVRGLSEDNAGVIVNVKGEMKGSAITRPVSQEHFGEVSRQATRQRSVRSRTTCRMVDGQRAE